MRCQLIKKTIDLKGMDQRKSNIRDPKWSKSLFFMDLKHRKIMKDQRSLKSGVTCAMETGLERDLPGSQCRRIACYAWDHFEIKVAVISRALTFIQFLKNRQFLWMGPLYLDVHPNCSVVSCPALLTASSCFLWGRRPRDFCWIPAHSVAYRHSRFLMAINIDYTDYPYIYIYMFIDSHQWI